jgi:hypothetical protein
MDYRRILIPAMLNAGKIGNALVQKDAGRLHLSGSHLDFAKYVFRKAIYNLTRLNLGAHIILVRLSYSSSHLSPWSSPRLKKKNRP